MSCASQSALKSIAILQKKAIRTISNAKYNEHTPPLFAMLRILPFDKIIQESKLKFMHSVKYNYCPLSSKHMGIKCQQTTQP